MPPLDYWKHFILYFVINTIIIEYRYVSNGYITYMYSSAQLVTEIKHTIHTVSAEMKSDSSQKWNVTIPYIKLLSLRDTSKIINFTNEIATTVSVNSIFLQIKST